VKILSQIKCIDGVKLAYMATTIAMAISEEFDNDDINILSSFFSAIGDNLGIISSQQEAFESCRNKIVGKDN